MATLSSPESARPASSAIIGMSVVGRLSTQKYPRSSSARTAWVLPAPERPVRMTNRRVPRIGRPAGRAGRAVLAADLAFAGSTLVFDCTRLGTARFRVEDRGRPAGGDAV